MNDAEWAKAYDEVKASMRAEGYRIVKAEPESFTRIVNGRETIRIASELL